MNRVILLSALSMTISLTACSQFKPTTGSKNSKTIKHTVKAKPKKPIVPAYNEKKLRNPGKVSGVIEDAKTKKPLAGIRVDIYKNGRRLVSKKTRANGQYTLPLEAGNYTIKVNPKNHVAETIHVKVKSKETTTVARLRQVPKVKVSKKIKKGIAKGKILDASNGKAIPRATLRIRRGVDAKLGKAIAYASTNGAGAYKIASLPAGNYTVEVSKKDHLKTYFNMLLINGKVLGKQNASLSPKVAKGVVRIVLSWSDKPGDLDSHLFTPSINGRSYHIYYSSNGKKHPEAKILLDVDRTDLKSSSIKVVKKGPETITIYKSYLGTYRYLVNNYSAGSITSKKGKLIDSRAKVDIYTNKGLLRTFYVPNAGKGTVWDVFRYNGSTGRVTPVNTIKNSYR